MKDEDCLDQSLGVPGTDHAGDEARNGTGQAPCLGLRAMPANGKI